MLQIQGGTKKAFFAKKKCVTILDIVSCTETMSDNRNQLAKASTKDILEKLETPQEIKGDYMPFGDGHAADKIVYVLEDFEFGKDVLLK